MTKFFKKNNLLRCAYLWNPFIKFSEFKIQIKTVSRANHTVRATAINKTIRCVNLLSPVAAHISPNIYFI